MNKKALPTKYKILVDIFIFLFSFLIFYLALQYYNDIDLRNHVQSIQMFNQGEIPLQGHFLFFILVSIFSFFSTNYDTIVIITCIILATSVILKRIVTEYLIIKIANGLPITYIFLISTGFIFLTNMPTHPPFKGV